MLLQLYYGSNWTRRVGGYYYNCNQDEVFCVYMNGLRLDIQYVYVLDVPQSSIM